MTDGYLKFHHWRILWSSYRKLALSGIWTHEYWILFRHSNRLSYQDTSSTSTQSQFCTTTPFSSFVQCHISFRLFASVSHHVYFNRNFLYIYIYILWKNIYLFRNSSKLSISNNLSISMIWNILWILAFSVSLMLTAFL